MIRLRKLSKIPIIGTIFFLWLLNTLDYTFSMLQILHDGLSQALNFDREYENKSENEDINIIPELQRELK